MSLRHIFDATLPIQVNNSWVIGDVNGARRSSQIAARLNIVAVVTGIAILVAVGAVAVTGVIFAIIFGAADSENNY